MLRESDLQLINNQLDDIFAPETNRISLDDLDDITEVSECFATIFTAISRRLHEYDNRVKIPTKLSGITVIDIYGALENLRPHFEVSATILKYRTLNFLCTHLQAEIIASPAAAAKVLIEKQEENRRKISTEFDKICRNLQITHDGIESREETISRITSCLTGIVSTVPESLLLNPPKILGHLAGPGCDQSLSTAQAMLVRKIELALYEDFSIRRQMLLKRFDVTIKSFSRPGKSENEQNKMLETIKMKRDDLPEAPRKYKLEDSLQAPISLLYESAKRVTDIGGRSKKVAYVSKDKVPDRGGRVNDLRPKAEKPNYGDNKGKNNRYMGKNSSGGGPREIHHTEQKNPDNQSAGQNSRNRRGGKGKGNQGAEKNAGSQAGVKTDSQSQSVVKNTDSQSAVKNTDSQSGVKNTDSQSGVKNTDSQSAVKNTDSQSGVKNTDSQSAVKNTDSQSAVKNTDSQSAVKNTDSQSGVKNTDSQSAVKNTDSQSAVKNTDSQSAVKNTDSQSAVKNTDSQSAVKNTDSQSAVKNIGGQSNVKKVANNTGRNVVVVKNGSSVGEKEEGHRSEGKTASDGAITIEGNNEGENKKSSKKRKNNNHHGKRQKGNAGASDNIAIEAGEGVSSISVNNPSSSDQTK